MKSAALKIWIFDIVTVLGFFLTALGTYLTIKSGVAVKILKDDLSKVYAIIFVISLIAAYHYFYKAAFLESVLDGHKSIESAKNKMLEIQRDPKSLKNVQRGIQDMSEVCQHIAAAFRKYNTPDVSVCIHYINVEEGDAKGHYVNVLLPKYGE